MTSIDANFPCMKYSIGPSFRSRNGDKNFRNLILENITLEILLNFFIVLFIDSTKNVFMKFTWPLVKNYFVIRFLLNQSMDMPFFRRFKQLSFTTAAVCLILLFIICCSLLFSSGKNSIFCIQHYEGETFFIELIESKFQLFLFFFGKCK